MDIEGVAGGPGSTRGPLFFAHELCRARASRSVAAAPPLPEPPGHALRRPLASSAALLPGSDGSAGALLEPPPPLRPLPSP